MTKLDWTRSEHRMRSESGYRRWSQDDYPINRRQCSSSLSNARAAQNFRAWVTAHEWPDQLPPVNRILKSIRSDLFRYRDARRQQASPRRIRRILQSMERNLEHLERAPKPLPPHRVNLPKARHLIHTHRRLLETGDNRNLPPLRAAEAPPAIH